MSFSVIVITGDIRLVEWSLLFFLLTLVVLVAIGIGVGVDLHGDLFLTCLSLLLLLLLWWWRVFEFSHLIHVHHVNMLLACNMGRVFSDFLGIYGVLKKSRRSV